LKDIEVKERENSRNPHIH